MRWLMNLRPGFRKRAFVWLLSIVISPLALRCRTAPPPDADRFGPRELQVAAYLSLLRETKGSSCVAAGDPVSRRPRAPSSPGVLAVVQRHRPWTLGYAQCPADSPVVTITWTTLEGERAIVGAARWSGIGLVGGVLCDMQLRRSQNGWETVRPCKETVITIVH